MHVHKHTLTHPYTPHTQHTHLMHDLDRLRHTSGMGIGRDLKAYTNTHSLTHPYTRNTHT